MVEVIATTQQNPSSAISDRDARKPACRFCGRMLVHTFVDLGTTSLCQRHVTPAMYNEAEPTWPLHAFVCDGCFLVQVSHEVKPEFLFDEQYGYFSSFSDSWLKHAADYVRKMTERLGLTASSRVVELASNDGYLLQYFVQRGIRVLGIEPTANTADAARKKGVPTLGKFFGRETAREVAADGKADLLIGNNVLAHVPDLNDFVAGMKLLLKPGGTITMEFPHLLRLMSENQFDTIYHEHFSYFSFYAVEQVFAHQGLTLFDVEELATHGGSLRIYGKHVDDSRAVSSRVKALRDRELSDGVNDLSFYGRFTEQVKETKRRLLEFLIEAKRQGKLIVGYGAPGKGNTLLNYCGIRTDFIDYTVDRSPHKQGNFLPGSRIPIYAPERISQTKPNYVLILPWNLREEISKQMAHVRDWGGKFVVPIPAVEVF